MTAALVNTSKDDGVMVLELKNPPANTYSYEMMRELDAHVLDARMDASVHVVMITGAGEKFFCAGADIGMLERRTLTSSTTSVCTRTRRCAGSSRRPSS